MLANFMIGLREGLEAALVVGILIAYLRKQNRHSDVRAVSFGVIAAIIVSLISGLLLSILVADTEDGANQIIGASASFLAVIFVTWMIFWMAKHSRSLPSEMHNKLEKVSSTFAVVGIVVGSATGTGEGFDIGKSLMDLGWEAGIGLAIGAGLAQRDLRRGRHRFLRGSSRRHRNLDLPLERNQRN